MKKSRDKSLIHHFQPQAEGHKVCQQGLHPALSPYRPSSIQPLIKAYPVRVMLLATACWSSLSVALPSTPVLAEDMPSQGVVTAGTATISSASNDHLIINQTTDKAIINWQSFSIYQGGTVTFQQPSSSSATLNRVTGDTPSSIAGKLEANGKVILINPNGIAFLPGSQVNTSGIVATALDMKDDDFLNDHWSFKASNPDSKGVVSNEGIIDVSDGGFVALLGGAVSNQGVISAKLGRIGLASGDKITLDISGDQFLSVALEAEDAANYQDIHGRSLASLIENEGELKAAGGQIELSAATLSTMMRQAVGNRGSLEATSFALQDGKIVLSAGDGGMIRNEGTIKATGNAALGEDGGTITIKGQSLSSTGTISASGAKGGTVQLASLDQTTLAGSIIADGESGIGGKIDLTTDRLLETSSSFVSANGITQGGEIRVQGDSLIMSSGHYQANASLGNGGTIAMTSDGGRINLFSASLAAKGGTQGDGGLIRLGGEFQGGKPHDADDPLLADFVTRFGAQPALSHTASLLINDGSLINVSGGQKGGTAILWSDQQTTMTGSIIATGAAGLGGAVEVSSANQLRAVSLPAIDAGSGGTILLDPADLEIGDSITAMQWSYLAMIGEGETGSGSINQATDSGDRFGYSLALSDDGTKLAVGSYNDDGKSNGKSDSGAVYLYSFSDDHFSGGSLTTTIGYNYAVNVSLLTQDRFGSSVAMNGAGTLLAVGAELKDGYNSGKTDSGSVYLFSLPSSFNTASLEGTIGYGYTGSKDINVTTLTSSARFGSALAISDDGNLLAIGAMKDDGIGSSTVDSGLVYLFKFSNSDFSSGSLVGTIGKGYTGASDINLSQLAANDNFGTSLAMNSDGTMLAVGAKYEDGYNNTSTKNYGTVFLFNFGSNFSSGSHVGTIGNGYGSSTDGKKNLSLPLESNDVLGAGGLAMSNDGKLLLIGAYGDDGYGATLDNAFDSNGYGAVYKIGFSASDFSGINLIGTIGKDYTGTNDINMSNLEYGAAFGASIAINATGSLMAIGAIYKDTPAAEADDGAVYLFDAAASNLSYSATTNYINVKAIEETLGRGTSLSFSASNDLTLSADLSASLISGYSSLGSLTLQAGRSLLLNNSITLADSNLTLVANDTLANGVVNADRQAGTAAITMASGTSINVGTGNVTATMRDGAGKTNSTAGDITLQTITANQITILNQGAESNNNLILNGNLTATSNSGVSLLLESDRLTNNASASVLQINSGAEYQIYLSDRSNSNVDSLNNYSFLEYGVSYGSNPSRTGNGVFFGGSYGITASFGGSVSKIYDSNTDLTSVSGLTSSISGLFNGDDYNADITSLVYNDKDVADANHLVDNGHLITSLNDSNGKSIYGWNYNFTSTTSASITPYALTATSYTAQDKIYDASLTATINSGAVSGVFAGDIVATSATGLFDDKNVGTNKGVTISYALGGADAGNYTLADTASNATITPYALTATSYTAQDKIYDASTNATINSGAVSGVFAGDTVATSASGLFADKNAGTNKGVTISYALSGADAGNYTLADTTSTATITPYALTASNYTAQDKIYDATTNATITAGSVNLLGSDSLNVTAAGLFDDKNVGTNKGVTISYALGGADAGNYTLADTTSTAAITPFALTASNYTAQDKIYDTTTTANLTAGSVNLLGSDVLSVTAAGLFADKNVGTNKGVTISYALSGADAGNYTLADTTSNATITPYALTATSYTAQDKIYDASLTATINSGAVSGVFTGDIVATSASGLFDDKNVGTNKGVTISYALSGADAGNYTLADTTSTATITQAELNVLAQNVTKIFSQADPPLTYSYQGLLSDQDASELMFSGSLSREAGEAVGNYQIQQGSLDLLGGNYRMNFTPAYLSILASYAGVDLSSFIANLNATATNKVDLGNSLVTYEQQVKNFYELAIILLNRFSLFELPAQIEKNKIQSDNNANNL